MSLCLNLLLPTFAFSQRDDLSIKAEELIYSNPDEAIKIADHIIKTSLDPQKKALSNLIFTKSYLVKGDYSNAIKYIFDDINSLEEVSLITKTEINILKSKLFRKLYLDKQTQKHLLNAEVLVSNLPNDLDKTNLQFQIKIEQINRQIVRLENNNALTSIEEIEKIFKEFINSNLEARKNLYILKLRVYNNLADYNKVQFNLNKTLALIDSSSVINLYSKAQVYKDLGNFYMQQRKFVESEKSLLTALESAKVLNNPILLMQINRDLAINYLAENKIQNHKIYNDEFLLLNTQVDLLEDESITTLYNTLSIQEDTLIIAENKKYTKYIYIFLAGLFLVLFASTIILLRSQAKKKRLNDIIKYIEISKNHFNTFNKSKPTSLTNIKRIYIPEETEQNLLIKLKRFENSRLFLNKDISLAVLAGKFDTNTKYLSATINKHYNDNFNTFINKLRINYIIEKLNSDPNYVNYKISFLAEECGYSSHSSFATIFKSIVGMSPTTFIMLVYEERTNSKLKKA